MRACVARQPVLSNRRLRGLQSRADVQLLTHGHVWMNGWSIQGNVYKTWVKYRYCVLASFRPCAELADGLGYYVRPQVVDKLLDGTWPQIAFRPVAHGDSARLCFFAAKDEHVGNLLKLCIADFCL